MLLKITQGGLSGRIVRAKLVFISTFPFLVASIVRSRNLGLSNFSQDKLWTMDSSRLRNLKSRRMRLYAKFCKTYFHTLKLLYHRIGIHTLRMNEQCF